MKARSPLVWLAVPAAAGTVAYTLLPTPVHDQVRYMARNDSSLYFLHLAFAIPCSGVAKFVADIPLNGQTCQ